MDVTVGTFNLNNLFSRFNTHLKSHFVPCGEDPVAGAQLANAWRRRQAEMVARIVARRIRPCSASVVLGDMNDPPDFAWPAPLTGSAALGLTNALRGPVETRPAKRDTVAPALPA